jgi:hypothetical protein
MAYFSSRYFVDTYFPSYFKLVYKTTPEGLEDEKRRMGAGRPYVHPRQPTDSWKESNELLLQIASMIAKGELYVA